MKLQHELVVVDLDKKALKKIVRKERIVRSMWKLNENRTRVILENRVEEKKRVSTHAPDLWNTFKDGVLRACDEVCGKKKEISRRDRVDMSWWNEEVKYTRVFLRHFRDPITMKIASLESEKIMSM